LTLLIAGVVVGGVVLGVLALGVVGGGFVLGATSPVYRFLVFLEVGFRIKLSAYFDSRIMLIWVLLYLLL
jgi:hypothetical protein